MIELKEHNETEKDEIVEDLTATRKRITEILEKSITARNSDMWLIYVIWQRQGLNISWNEFQKVINPETIIRIRATLQNDEHKFLPTIPDVLIKRKIREKILREYFGTDSLIYKDWQDKKYEVK